MPLHPKFVHLPIALAVLMPLVMTGVIAAWRRGALPRRARWMAVAVQAVLALSTVAALRSGEADEGLPRVPDRRGRRTTRLPARRGHGVRRADRGSPRWRPSRASRFLDRRTS